MVKIDQRIVQNKTQ